MHLIFPSGMQAVDYVPHRFSMMFDKELPERNQNKTHFIFNLIRDKQNFLTFAPESP